MHRNQLITALALLLAAAAVSAQPRLSNEDCEILAQAVKDHVWRAATEAKLERAAPRPLAMPLGGSSHRVCRRTAEVTTRAFTEALALFGLTIGWEPPDPGDYCLSVHREQCYPGVDDPLVPHARVAFVYEAWLGVRGAVESLMPAGSAGNVAVFSKASLDQALASHLDRSVAAPLYARRVR